MKGEYTTLLLDPWNIANKHVKFVLQSSYNTIYLLMDFRPLERLRGHSNDKVMLQPLKIKNKTRMEYYCPHSTLVRHIKITPCLPPPAAASALAVVCAGATGGRG